MNTKTNTQNIRLELGETIYPPTKYFLTWLVVLLLGSAGTFSARAAVVDHGIAAGMITITNTGTNFSENVATYNLNFTINDFRVSAVDRGDYGVQIGSSRTDDIANGILMACSIEPTRLNYGTNDHPITTAYPVLPTTGYIIGGFNTNAEANVNVAGAWFPYSKYIGGSLTNTNNNTAMSGFSSASPGMTFNVNYITNGGGRGIIDLHSFGIDSRTDGVLLVTGAKNENNFALSQVVASNGTWNIFCKDNGVTGAGTYEADPVSFVFIPKTNSSLISGRFIGNGTIEMFSGDSPQFTVTPLSGGRWTLAIPGHSPTNGILMISPEGGANQNLDNWVSYQVTGNTWEIQSRDTPQYGLQTPNGGVDPIISFVYIPAATPGFSVTPTNNLLTTESLGTASFTVALHNQPSADVVINVASDNTAEGTVSPSSLTFTTSDWNVPQTVTVTGVDDVATDGSVTYNIILSPATSSDAGYNGLNPSDVSVVNADNEVGITVSAVTATTTEAGGASTFTVRLNTLPSADVTIAISSSDTTEGTVSTSSLTFTSTDGDQPQTVTVTGVNDSLDDGNIGYTILTAAASSADGNYNNLNAADVLGLNIDDDTTGITVTPSSGLDVSETGTTTNFTVVLTSQPAANVTVNLSSGDPSEGSISPTSLVFTPGNWFTPQPVTLTGVNDFSNDGNITYNISGTVTSGDSLYAALLPTASARTLDNEAQLILSSGTLTYSIGTPGTAIDSTATVSDPDTANYNSGSLTVSLTANGATDDRVEIRNVGTGTGQIGVSGNNVSYEGITIGSFSGGVGTSPLVITLNSAATPVAVQALIRAVTFRNTNSSPSMAVRTVTFALADGQGGTSSASRSIQFRLMRIFDFQEGVDNGLGTYTGAADIELNSLFPTTPYPEGSSANGLLISVNQATLLRFDNIIGAGPTQIPTNAVIVSAELFLTVADGGHGSPMYRMLTNWNETSATWNDNLATVARDDVHARSTFDSQWGIDGAPPNAASGTGLITFGVTPDVQAWINGETNYGWVMPGWQFQNDPTAFRASEFTNSTARPRLRVKWLPAGASIASFRQGVDSYSGTRDTRIGEDAPDTVASTGVTMFVDGEANGGEADQVQVLMRFNDIVGAGAGQIPVGATVHAAILEIGSTIGAAPGDGGQFFAMLQTWEDTATWNSFSGHGVFADGTIAASVPSASAGSIALAPDVQGGFLPFELTSDVQDWVNGTKPNYGWAIIPWPLGGNGWGMASSENTVERDRPRLRVFYAAVAGDVITMLMPIVTPSSVQIRFTGTIGTQYSVRRAGVVSGSYNVIGTATVQPNGIGTFNDNSPLPGGAFYRVSNP